MIVIKLLYLSFALVSGISLLYLSITGKIDEWHGPAFKASVRRCPDVIITVAMLAWLSLYNGLSYAIYKNFEEGVPGFENSSNNNSFELAAIKTLDEISNTWKNVYLISLPGGKTLGLGLPYLHSERQCNKQ